MNLKNKLIASMALLAFVACYSPVSAQIQYGFFADSGNTPGIGNGFISAGEVFVPSTTFTATDISFYGTYYGGSVPTSDSFAINLYDSVGGTLLAGTNVGSLSITDTGLGGGWGTDAFQYQGTLGAPLSLTANTSYFLELSDTTTPYESFLLGYTYGANTEASYNYSSGYYPNSGYGLFITLSDGVTSLDFTTDLTGGGGPASVPEPSTWALGILGLAVLGALRLRVARA